MNSPTRDSKKAALLIGFLFAVAYFYNTSIFFFSSDSIANPTTPLWFKVLKDILSLGSFVLLARLLWERQAPLPAKALTLLLYPAALALLMLIATLVFQRLEPGYIAALKNYGIYYVISGFVVVATRFFRLETWVLEMQFRFMRIVVLVGLALYAVQIYSGINFTHSGRMVSTLGNPNFMGFVAEMLIVLTTGQLLADGRLTRTNATQLLLGAIGLVLSMSFAAILSFVLWAILLLPMLARAHVQPRFLPKLLLQGLVSFFALGIGTLLLGSFSNSVLFEKIRVIMQSETGSSYGFIGPRMQSMQQFLYTLGSSWRGFFAGHETGPYYETDGAFLNLGLNFGAFILGGWLLFFIGSVAKGILLGRQPSSSLQAKLTPRRAFVMVVTPFLLVSTFFHFWIQYLPEKYPTCLLIGWLAFELLLPHRSESRSSGVCSDIDYDATRTLAPSDFLK